MTTPIPDVPAENPPVRMRVSRSASKARQIGRGRLVFKAGDHGPVFEVRQGTVRLDRVHPDGQREFAGIAMAGDWLGIEVLAGGRYGFDARALTPCSLSVCTDAATESAPQLLLALMRAEVGRAQLLSLCRGPAAERVQRLLGVLAEAGASVVMPARKDLADITGLTIETVSRVIATMRREGLLQPCDLPGARKDNAFLLDGDVFAPPRVCGPASHPRSDRVAA